MHKILRKHEQPMTQRWCPEQLEAPAAEQAIRHQAQMLLDEAQQQATELLETACQDAIRLKREGYDTGLDEGRAAGEREYVEQCLKVRQFADELARERDEFFMRVEPELIKLAMTIARKVVTQELSIAPETVTAIVGEHLQQLRDREHIRVRVHPDDLPLLQLAHADLLHDLEGAQSLTFVADHHLDRGGAVLETPGGSLDARLATRLSMVDTGLSAMLGSTLDGQDN